MTAQDVTQPPLQAPPAEDAGVGTQKRGRLRIIPLLGLMVIAAAGVFVWRTFFTAPPIPDSIVTLSGRIEGDDSAIAPKVNGKILRVTVREGDSVRLGDVIAILDDAQIRAQEDQARAALQSARARHSLRAIRSPCSSSRCSKTSCRPPRRVPTPRDECGRLEQTSRPPRRTSSRHAP